MVIAPIVAPNISLIFGTPALVDQVPDCEALNAGLKRIILAREAASRGILKSNRGGWHSEIDLLAWPEPEIARLKLVIDGAVQRISRMPAREHGDKVKLAYRCEAWANVNRNSDYNGLHSHSGFHWAVVYYVATGEEAPGYPRNGSLELRDPRPAATHGRLAGFYFGREFVIRPKPGIVVAFPAWVEHGVNPFFGTGERISIAVNVKVAQLELPPEVAEPAA